MVLAEIGLITPPFGLNLFTIQGSFPNFRSCSSPEVRFPFLGTMILMVWILIFFPKLALWLPKILYGRGGAIHELPLLNFKRKGADNRWNYHRFRGL